jgi:tRNA-modifying protein YgfZ
MSMEATEQIQLNKSPLDQWHIANGASMIGINGWSLPAHYGNYLDEYNAVRNEGAGLIDLSTRGRIRVTGSEAIQFLNGLITNDMKTLAENSWMPAVFPNVQGRIVASVRIARLNNQEGNKGNVPVFLIETELATHEVVFKTLERFSFAGDFHVSDVSNATGEISVQGSKAERTLAKVLGDAWQELAVGGIATFKHNDTDVVVIRASHTGEDGFDLIVATQELGPLASAIKNAGATPVGLEAFDILRIEGGVALYGPDFDDTLVVSEANLDDAVSFTKGCYIGQEIIARIKYRGHVAKKITGVVFDGFVSVLPGTVLVSEDGKEVGRLTSVTDSPKLQKTIALALIKYQYLSAGTKLTVKDTDARVTATVTDFPFVKSI